MLANTPELGFAATQQLGYIWDTVGWIYFRRGEFEKALPYIRASWLLSQASVVGDHLGQIYAKLGKTQEAAPYPIALLIPRLEAGTSIVVIVTITSLFNTTKD